ncbi:hypothetical protein K438DRAFT_1765958 [Mycena galopus ATCC 62051]|nr:hypothetical protein K438DRAFT_1765958 [Mycena galopus ATCC 62051]
MALSTVQVRVCLKLWALYWIVVIFCYVAPAPIKEWVTDTTSRAFAALTFCVAVTILGIFVKDAFKWLTRGRSDLGPVALEDGSAAPPSYATNAETAPPITLHLNLTAQLVLLVSSSAFFLQQISPTVSLQRPLTENLSAAFLYILRGLEVLFSASVVLAILVWLRKPLAAEGVAADGSLVQSAEVPKVALAEGEMNSKEIATKDEEEKR